MIRKVIVVQVDSISNYPPTLSLIEKLINLGTKVYLLSSQISEEENNIIPNEVIKLSLGIPYNYDSGVFYKTKNLLIIRKKIWDNIDSIYDENTIIWVMSNIALKHLGKRLLRYRYNIHLFELMDEVYYFGKIPFLKIGLANICKNANKVITCEYNRAQITKVWFKLNNLPLVIVNRPRKSNFMKNNSITHSHVAKEVINNLKNRKIILYQGIVDKERPIEVISKAVELLGKEYAFVVMTASKVDFIEKYENTFIIPFVLPPYHLEITSNAYIGVLIYSPVYGEFASPLNSIYCAPNKLYEYSQFCIPMIGNDIPGLKYTIEYNFMGDCFKHFNENEIIKSIKNCEINYKEYSKNAGKFYLESDCQNIVKLAITE